MNASTPTPVFVVQMDRWGDDESHTYVVGVFSSRMAAMHAGIDEKNYRGGKYEPRVVELGLDDWYTRKAERHEG